MKLLVSITILVTSSFALAQWFVEPYVGLDIGVIDATCKGTGNCSPAGNYTYGPSGLALGTRGGYSLGSFFFGMDFQATMAGQITIQSQPVGANKPNDNFYKLMLDLQGGWGTEKFKFWGGLILLNNLVDQGSAGNKTFGGDGFRIGAGINVTPNFMVNFNYDYQNFKKVDFNGANYDIGNDYSKFNSQVFHFNVSFPFTFEEERRSSKKSTFEEDEELLQEKPKARPRAQPKKR
jgi:hypothetical protein